MLALTLLAVLQSYTLFTGLIDLKHLTLPNAHIDLFLLVAVGMWLLQGNALFLFEGGLCVKPLIYMLSTL